MTRYGSIIITGTDRKEMAELGRDLRLSISKLVHHVGWHNHWIFTGPGQSVTRIISFAVFDEARLADEAGARAGEGE